MIVDCVDSYYQHVVQQMTIVDSTQLFGGYLASRDWPMTPPIENALYLLSLPITPSGGSKANREFEYLLQWNWLVIGADIGDAQVGQNRASRFRTDMKIKDNLRNANYPGYCAKQTYSADANGNLIATSLATPAVGGAESIWWTELQFSSRNDNQKSGLLYGTASIRLYGIDNVLASVA